MAGEEEQGPTEEEQGRDQRDQDENTGDGDEKRDETMLEQDHAKKDPAPVFENQECSHVNCSKIHSF